MKFSKSLKGVIIYILCIVVIFLIGDIFQIRYEKAKENGYEVEATVVEVEPREEYDYAMEIYETVYVVYADYEVDGKKYEHIEVGKYDTADEYYEGKVIKVVVNPDSPDEPMDKGTLWFGIGVLLTIPIICVIILKIKDKVSHIFHQVE